jgi:hypothetical protein
MKFAAKSLLFLMSLAATFTYAQTLPPGTFKHIIIVVQENRTPDNLFGSGSSGTKCGIEVPFEPGVDIENGGNVTGQQQPQCLIPLPLNSWDATLNGGQIVDPGHYYADWGIDYDKGSMDGFCHKFGNTCPEYSYVPKSDVQPYFDIATNYGFANYFFQTNQGPSYPAHQFLFTGTSAPVAPKKNYYLDFVGGTNPSNFNESGCANNNNDIPSWVLPDGTQDFTPPISVECYPHDSLVTNSGGDKIVSWAYYTVPPRNIIWDAPAAIPEVCYGENDLDDVGQACGPQGENSEWNAHMRIADNGYSDAPIFDDLYNCSKPLPAISWVIPDFSWSDHPQDKGNALSTAYGPSWVADIVDAVGEACGGKYWTSEPTAIFVVWDDWGGWFDHIPPFQLNLGTCDPKTGVCSCPPGPGNPNGWGCGYTYGFRVPLLVVSPYTGTPTQTGYTGYVSGACGGSGLQSCPNNVFPYVHDFGSILRFAELNFGIPLIDAADNGYADANAPDGVNGNTPLSDLFPLPVNKPRPFTHINWVKDYTFFQKFYTTTGLTPTGPDTY